MSGDDIVKKNVVPILTKPLAKGLFDDANLDAYLDGLGTTRSP